MGGDMKEIPAEVTLPVLLVRLVKSCLWLVLDHLPRRQGDVTLLCWPYCKLSGWIAKQRSVTGCDDTI